MSKRLWRIIIGAAVLATAVLLNLNNEWLQIALFIISYIIVGGDVVKRAVKNIFKGQVFDESFLMSIATIGAFFIGEYPEGVAVMLFYQVGELFQSYAVGKSRKSIASLMDIRPDYANVKKGDELVKVDPDEVQIGDIIVIKAGEKIPLDGFDQGFLGGCFGKIDENTILFNGNIERLNSYDIIKNIVYKEKLNLLYPDTNLVDTGSLIWI